MAGRPNYAAREADWLARKDALCDMIADDIPLSQAAVAVGVTYARALSMLGYARRQMGAQAS